MYSTCIVHNGFLLHIPKHRKFRVPYVICTFVNRLLIFKLHVLEVCYGRWGGGVISALNSGLSITDSKPEKNHCYIIYVPGQDNHHSGSFYPCV